jgi:tetratricopeptide (TPR) repeat protein
MAANPSALWSRIICGTTLLAMLLVFPLTTLADHTEITLKGQVRTAGGEVIRMGVMAYLKGVDEVPVASIPVGSDGNFEFDNVTPAIYYLIVTADKFKPYQQRLDLSSFVKLYLVRVVLTPVDETGAKNSDLPALTDEAAPKQARKEYEKGSRAYSKKKYAEARVDLEEAVAQYPCYARAQTALARLNLAENKQDEAEANLKKAVRCDGTFMNSYFQLAQLYYGERKFAKSEEILLRGLRISPSSWLLHFQLGAVRFAQGEYRKSAKEFETAESIHPDIPADLHVQVVNAYLKLGENSKALAEIDTYLRLDPDGKYAESGRKISQILRSNGVAAASTVSAGPSHSKP